LRVEEVVLLLTASDEYVQELKKIGVPMEAGNAATLDIHNKINLYCLRLFSRNAAPVEILDWSAVLASNGVSFDYLGLILANAGLDLPANGEAGIMKSVLLSRLEPAQSYTETISIDPAKVAAYTTIEAVDKGRAFLDGVTFKETVSPESVRTHANLLVSLAVKTTPATPPAESGPPVFTII
jgi:hypothetical protein